MDLFDIGVGVGGIALGFAIMALIYGLGVLVWKVADLITVAATVVGG